MSAFEIDLDSGDPIVREWFLVRSKYWPICICATYFIIAKYVGVWLMKDKQPFNLRIPLTIYNAFIVFAYSYYLIKALYYLMQIDRKMLCDKSELKDGIPMELATIAWLCYLVKYVELLDTLFFILRKKNNLLTNLHIIHHTLIPLTVWLMMRVERSGFHSFPLVLNSIIHIIMYTYYGLSSVSPSMRKYLWWKRYLTLTQMFQFVIVFLFTIIYSNLSGCYTSKLTKLLNTVQPALFFCLFVNYYYQNYIKKKPKKST